jgi:hypothetical protein
MTVNRYYHETDRNTLVGPVPVWVGEQFDVVTNIVKNAGVTKSSVASNTSAKQQSQGGYTHPTQMKNGTYPINEARAPTTGGGDYGTGEQGLYINITQQLLGIDPETLEPNGEIYQDTGYMIHITPYKNTLGCIGIKYESNVQGSKDAAIARMESLVNLYKEALRNGEQVFIKIID